MAIPSGSAVLANNYNIATSGTWFPTGTDVSHQPLTISLPAAGTYLITGNVRIDGKVSVHGGFLAAAIFDQAITSFSSYPTQTPVANSVRFLWVDTTGSNVQAQLTLPITIIYTATGATTISLGVMRADIGGTPTWTTAQITSDSNGATNLAYVQLSPAPVTFENSVTFDNSITVVGSINAEGDVTVSTGQQLNVLGGASFSGPMSMADGVNVTLDGTTGNKFGISSTDKIGFLGATPVVQQTGGSKTAAGTYGANEQTMLQTAYNALRTFGLLS